MIRPRALCEMKPGSENNQPQNKYSSSLPEGFLEKIPQYTDVKKEFPSKTKKPMQFHERGILFRNFDRKQIEDLQSKEQPINFFNLLSQFKTDEEINNLNASDIFGVDSQLLKELQDKVNEFIVATSDFIELEKKEEKNEEVKKDEDFMDYLTTINIPMKQDSINLDVVISNLNKIDSISYSADSVTVNFDK